MTDTVFLTRRTFVTGLAATAAFLSANVVPATSARALTVGESRALIDQVMTEIMAVINSGRSEAAMLAEFESIFARYADVNIIAQSALGPPARQASQAQLRAFTEAFRGYMARKYGRRFRELIGGTVRVTGARQVQTYFDVNTVVDLRGQATVEVRVKGNITANLSGQLLDASETELSPLPGEIALFQPDGSTSLFPNRTNVITTDEFGNFSLTDSAFELFGGFIVAEFSSENYVSQTLTIPVSNGTVDFDSEVYLSPLAFIGEVRREDGLLVPGNDVYLQIWNDGIVEPYPFPGGIDAQPPLAPTGVNHVTLTNQLGEYYIPIRLEDGEREFSITANNRPNLSGFSVASFNVETPQSGSLVQDFILNEVFGAGDCNDVFPPTLTFNWDDVQEIFDNHCIGCHGVRNPNAGLSLAEGFSFSSLMERPSVISPKLLVDITSAGDAVANSFLVEKVRCTQPAFGSLMPPTGKLTGREINIIGTWARQTKNQPVLGVFEPALYASATEGSSPLRVEFRGGVRTDADQAPFSFNWNFDNGMTSVNQDAPAGLFVVPEGEQEFEVTLFIRNKDGELLGESTELISISAPDPDPENQSPVAIINAPTFIDANTTINLDGSDSFDPDGLIIAWQWDIGNNGEFDITTSSNQVNWTFEEDGIYPVRLTVTDNQNAQSSSVKYLFVGEFDRLFDGFIIH